jgi:hypothetical protein
VEAVEFHQGWSVAKNKGDVRKKRRRPRKVVCLHKKGTWERRKENDQLSPQEGDVKKKKKKKKDQGRREGGSAKERFRVSSTKKFLFLVHEYLGSERPISFDLSAPTRPCLQRSHVRRKFRQRTTLRSESSTLKGLLYAPIKREQYHKDYSTQVEDPAVNVARNAALSPWSVVWVRKLSSDKRQSTFIHELEIPTWFHT